MFFFPDNSNRTGLFVQIGILSLTIYIYVTGLSHFMTAFRVNESDQILQLLDNSIYQIFGVNCPRCSIVQPKTQSKARVVGKRQCGNVVRHVHSRFVFFLG